MLTRIASDIDAYQVRIIVHFVRYYRADIVYFSIGTSTALSSRNWLVFRPLRACHGTYRGGRGGGGHDYRMADGHSVRVLKNFRKHG